jgi:hypothetical protein
LPTAVGRRGEALDCAPDGALRGRRLSDKKEQVLEKDLVLDEVTTLTTKLGTHGAPHCPSAPPAADGPLCFC